MARTIRLLGIHLAGAHTKKSAAVRGALSLSRLRSGAEAGSLAHERFCEGVGPYFPGVSCVAADNEPLGSFRSPLLWEAYSAEIGPSPHRDSDARFVEVVADMGGADIICIDAPLSLPPCVTCARPCPGTLHCVVPEVALMRTAWEQKEERKRTDRSNRPGRAEKRIKLPQPYVERAFEAYARANFEHPLLSGTFEMEAALGSNRAPVTARAMRLRRELHTRFPQALIVETNSALAALGWSLTSGYQLGSLLDLRSSVNGRSARAGMLKRLEQRQIALRSATLHEELFTDFAANSYVFHAALACLTGWGLLSGEIYLQEDFLKLNAEQPLHGWACVPKEAAHYAWGH